MTGLLYTVAPLALACAIARRERAHRPIRDALAAMTLYSAAQHVGPLPSAVSWALWLVMPLCSARAYASAWGWRWTEGRIVFAVCGAAIGLALAGRAASTEILTWAPFVASSLFGAAALWRWFVAAQWRSEDRSIIRRRLAVGDAPDDEEVIRWWYAREARRASFGIAQRCAVALLASDVAMLVFVPWPGVQAWQGRAMALAMAVIQGLWLIERRST